MCSKTNKNQACFYKRKKRKNKKRLFYCFYFKLLRKNFK